MSSTVLVLLAVLIADVPRASALSIANVPLPTYLCDLPTPALLVDMDALVPAAETLTSATATEIAAALEDVAYVHARVRSTTPPNTRSYHKDATYSLATLDVATLPGGAYLAMGLNNHCRLTDGVSPSPSPSWRSEVDASDTQSGARRSLHRGCRLLLGTLDGPPGEVSRARHRDLQNDRWAD